MNETLLSLSFETAQKINRALDVTHSFFPSLSLFAVIILFESFLPRKEYFENRFDRVYTYCKLPFLFLLNFIALSQALFGGCIIYYPQTWFNRRFLNVQEPYEYGLFARQYVSNDLWWLLRLIYIFLAALAVWRTWEFLRKRVIGVSIQK